MKQSGHLNPSDETGTGCTDTSKYGRTPPTKHGGVGRQQQQQQFYDPLQNVIEQIAKKGIVIVHGDWNAKVGEDATTLWNGICGTSSVVIP